MEQLYLRYYQSAVLYLTALCKNQELARDLVTDAFVKAYISLPGDSPSFQFWLFRVCKNLWYDHLRKHKHELDTESQSEPVSDSTPESRYLENERVRALWNAISTLPPLDRELVTLHYFSGLSLQEAAQLLGKSYPAVRQRMSRLRQTLKQQMEEFGYEY